MAEKRIFRQAALDRLASPEQLDHLVPVADAPGWIALSVCALLALAVLAWSVAGSLPATLAARGSLPGGGQALLQLPAGAAGAIRPGMEVVVLPAQAAGDGAAALRGKVERIVIADGVHAIHVELPRQHPIALLVPARR